MRTRPSALRTLPSRDVEMAKGTTDWSLQSVAWLYGYDPAQVGLSAVSAAGTGQLFPCAKG